LRKEKERGDEAPKLTPATPLMVDWRG